MGANSYHVVLRVPSSSSLNVFMSKSSQKPLLFTPSIVGINASPKSTPKDLIARVMALVPVRCIPSTTIIRLS